MYHKMESVKRFSKWETNYASCILWLFCLSNQTLKYISHVLIGWVVSEDMFKDF